MQNNRFFIEEITADGSPTLRVQSSVDCNLSEQMHHSAGAASETRYIYGEAVLAAQEHLPFNQTSYLVVGLGLGYIEILISLLSGLDFKQIVSFEKESNLILEFKSWLSKDSDQVGIYDRVFQSLNDKVEQKMELNVFRHKLKSKDILFLNEVNFDEQLKKSNVICYDAFSNHTDSVLWDANFLEKFIDFYCDEKCIFSSYAKTGTLSRALKNKGFKMLNRKGFAGKRESTLAIRGF